MRAVADLRILSILFVYFLGKAALCRIVILDREAHTDLGLGQQLFQK